MNLASSLVVSGSISWFQLLLDRFRPSLVLASTERLNFVQNFNHFDSQPLETLE